MVKSVKSVKSKGTSCTPRPRDGPCTRALAKDRRGGPIVLSAPCPYCKLWRCADHCDCNVPGKPTYGMRKGRKAGRSPADAKRVTRKVVPAIEDEEVTGGGESGPFTAGSPVDGLVSVKVPGRRPNLSVVVYGPEDRSWRALAIQHVRAALKFVAVVTYMYDHEELDKAIKYFLTSGQGRTCVILVDREMYDADACKGRERRMLKALSKYAGAHVYLGAGSTGSGRLSKHKGSMHLKELLIDGRVAYSGSANSTEASAKNMERMFKFTGHPVDDIASSLHQYMKSDKVELM